MHSATKCGHGPHRNRTHNGIVHELASILRNAGCFVSIEDPAYTCELPTGNIRPDIVIHNPNVIGYPANISKVMVDVSVSSYTYMANTGPVPTVILSRASLKKVKSTPMDILQANYKAKEDGYSTYFEKIRRPDYAIVPFILSSAGAIHSDSAEFLSEIASHGASLHELPKSNMEKYYIRRIIFQLFRGIAGAILGKQMHKYLPAPDYTFDPDFIRCESPLI